MFLSPNIDDDGHNTNVSFAGQWLDSFLSTRLLRFPKGTLIVVTWDEDDYSEDNQVGVASTGLSGFVYLNIMILECSH